MIFNPHYDLVGKHAFLSASQYHWLNYTNEKLLERYFNEKAKERGTRLHALAEEHINLGIYMPRSKRTFDSYVNDAISFMMKPEQPLVYSDICFGTADAISFKKDKLRIHDLKTGVTPASIKQLEIYAALFCLEYNIRPGDIEIELRMYQNNEVAIENAKANTILPIMDKIVANDKLIREADKEG